MLSAEDYGEELAERYGWVNRALPAAALGDFVESLAHESPGFHRRVESRSKAGSTLKFVGRALHSLGRPR
jgi:hypothetical protein